MNSVKPSQYRVVISFILLFLWACNVYVPTPMATQVLLQPTFTQPALTSTATLITITPSPLPTESLIPVITPDAIQVKQ